MDENITRGLFNPDSLTEASKGKVKAIDAYLIKENKLNEIYPQDDIDGLKENIWEFQLSQPIVVRKNKDGTYTIISGHRRFKACMELFEEGKALLFFDREYINQVPCVVDNRKYQNEDDEFLAIVSSNASRVLTPEERRLVADIAKEHDLWIIADEVYREFTYNGEPLATMGSFEDILDRLIIIDSVSKRFSAYGARVGAVICKNKDFQAEFMKLCQARLSVPTLDQLASASLYDVDPQYLKDVNVEYKRRRDTVKEELSKIPGLVFSEPEGAFYVMVKMPVDDAEKFLIWLLTEFNDNNETVMYAPAGGFYKTPGAGINEMRIAYILNCDDLRRAIQLLGKGIEQYNARK